jgi:hypothetical protein
MRLEIQYTADCPNARPILQRVKELAHQRTELTMTVTLVDIDHPVPLGFAGSPTVLIDGSNPFAGEPTGAAACALRPPTADQVEAAIVARS